MSAPATVFAIVGNDQVVCTCPKPKVPTPRQLPAVQKLSFELETAKGAVLRAQAGLAEENFRQSV
jgi:hypothetical protein